MPDLNEEIRKLKAEGMSLRRIAAALGISHEAVRKRLMAVNEKNQVSTNPEYQKLTAPTIKKEKVSTGSKPRKSRASKELKDTVNQVSTKETPSLPLNGSINPSGIASGKLPDRKKRVFQEVDSKSGDPFEGIKVFLESNGIEVYRMNVEPEGYQMKNNEQTIRI